MLIKVVAALIEKDNKVLIAKRSTGDPNVYGKWEFPGGKVELNEDEFHAIEREIFEEFELKIKAKEYIINNVCEYPTKTVDLRLYSCDYISGEFKLHDHSEIAWVNKNKLLNYDLAPADIPLAEYIKGMNKMKIEDFKLGKKYYNAEICETFKCSLMSGMNRSHTTNTLVLTAKHNKPLYDDQWNGDIFNYTGMGKSGDQSLEYKQNKTLYESNNNDIRVFLFESYVDGEYIFSGEVRLSKEPFFVDEPGEDGGIRKVVKFPLKRISNEEIIYDINDIERNENIKAKEVRKLSIDEIKDKAKKIENKKAVSKEVKTIYRERNQYISEYTKERAKGICDLCGEEAPFKDKNGKPYLETHHVVTLANEGPDAIYNTVAICPNCHRKIHVLNKKEDTDKLAKVILKYLLADNDEDNIKKHEELFK